MKRANAIQVETGSSYSENIHSVNGGNHTMAHGTIKGHNYATGTFAAVAIILFILMAGVFGLQIYRLLTVENETITSRLAYNKGTDVFTPEKLTPAYTLSSGFVAEAVELEPWMTDLTGWLVTPAPPAEAIFASEPFIEVQPWMMDPAAWLNPGYFEEFITVEPWMMGIEAWEAASLVEEPFMEVEEWMMDLTLWESPYGASMEATHNMAEEIVVLEPWMTDPDAWITGDGTTGSMGLSTIIEEPPVEVEDWMLSLEGWIPAREK